MQNKMLMILAAPHLNVKIGNKDVLLFFLRKSMSSVLENGTQNRRDPYAHEKRQKCLNRLLEESK